MSDSPHGMGPHDVGGEAAGAIDTTDHGMTHWEKHANALRMTVVGKRLCTLDELRRSCEGLGERYYQIGYFERQAEALPIVLIERGLLTQSGLDARVTEVTGRFDVPTIPLPEHPGHDHAPFQEDESGEGPNEHYLMNLAIQDLLEEQGLISAAEVREKIEKFDGDYPNRGPRVVARAWVDPDFKARLLEDARPAIEEVGVDLEHQAHLIALENTPAVHNLVVCTLCSCYPRFLMGQPPTWYKSRSYRSRAVHEPRAVLKEFGTVVPDDVTIRVHDSNADMRYIVVPMRPAGTETWDAAALEAIITRDALVGATVPAVPD